MTHVAIIGAGISGLSLAWFLKKRFGPELSITIIEKEKRTGGWIHTVRKDGFLFEQGPRSCRTKGTGEATLQLIEQLGLEDEVIKADDSAHARYIYHKQTLQRLPTGFLSFLCSPLMKGVIPAFIHEWNTPRGHADEESIHAFFCRRFNSSIAERLVDPLISGIFAGDIRQLSMKSCFPILYQWEQKYGSVLRGAFKREQKRDPKEFSAFNKDIRRSALFSFKGGMETLTQELTHQLDANILLDCVATACTWNEECISLTLSNQQTIQADHIFCAATPSTLINLISTTVKDWPKDLKTLAYASVAVVNFGYKESVLLKKGFGYLIPSRENEEILGVVWDSCVFPQQNQSPHETRLTVMIGGAHHPFIDKLSEDQCVEIALRNIAKHLNIKTLPTTVAVKLTHQAIPQYHVGYEKWSEDFKRTLTDLCPRLTLTGNTFNGIAVNDCIANSRAIALNFHIPIVIEKSDL